MGVKDKLLTWCSNWVSLPNVGEVHGPGYPAFSPKLRVAPWTYVLPHIKLYLSTRYAGPIPLILKFPVFKHSVFKDQELVSKN